MIDCNLENLQNNIKHESYKISEWIEGKIEITSPFQIKPRDFLQYAAKDLEIKNDHFGVNCLSNCKRAIECQIDTLFYSFGLYEKSKRERYNLPKKIETLNQLGVISPRILLKINKLRNLLEHEYSQPDLGKVEDAVDIATLFLNYSEKYLKNFLYEFAIKDINDYFTVMLDFENSKIVFTSIRRVAAGFNKNVVKEVDSDSIEYLDHLRWFLEISSNIK